MKEFRTWGICGNLIFFSICALSVKANLVIETTHGKVQGKTLTAASGKEVDAWFGIPYAQKPLFNLRFRPPLPADPWNDVLDATRLPPACMQSLDTSYGDFKGSQMWNANTNVSEDCLYLNVVVPKPRPENATVMVWIYGGGFSTGSSVLDIYDPKILVSEQNIIFVSMQYRVNLFGFLYFGNDGAPGNAGLYDQLLALQWVKENIAAFGGNPDSVTIFGESAGAGSTSHLSLSPLAKNLFKRSIMQSGSATAPWAVIPQEVSMERGYIMAKAAGCSDNPTNLDATLECLYKVDAEKLAKSEYSVPLKGFVQFAFLPVVDGKLISKNPKKLLEKGHFNDIDILLGANGNEGTYFLFYSSLEMNIHDEQVTLSHNDFIKHISAFVKSELALDAILHEYTNWDDPDNGYGNIMLLEQLIGDLYFTCPVQYLAEKYANKKRNVFLYHYEHANQFHYWPLWSGCMHADEIEFVFGHPLAKKHPYSLQQIEFSKQIMRYWTNFAKTGNPNGLSSTNTDPIWPPYEDNNRAYIKLNVDEISIGKRGLRPRQCHFVNSNLPKIFSLEGNTAIL